MKEKFGLVNECHTRFGHGPNGVGNSGTRLLLYKTMDKRLAMEGNIFSAWQQDTQLTIEDVIPIFVQHGTRIKLYCGRQKRRDRWNICSRWHLNDREMEKVWINFSGRRVTSWEGTGGTYIPDDTLLTGRWRCGSIFLEGEWLHYYTMQQGHKQIPPDSIMTLEEDLKIKSFL